MKMDSIFCIVDVISRVYILRSHYYAAFHLTDFQDRLFLVICFTTNTFAFLKFYLKGWQTV